MQKIEGKKLEGWGKDILSDEKTKNTMMTV